MKRSTDLPHKTAVHPESTHSSEPEESALAAQALADGDFDLAVHYATVAVAHSPKHAASYWIRLLALNGCRTDGELIVRGCDCAESADYRSAVKYSDGDEKERCLRVLDTIEKLKASLLTLALSLHQDARLSSKLAQTGATIGAELISRRQRLFDLWDELQSTEHELYIIETGIRLDAQEHRIALKKSRETAAVISAEASRLSSCTLSQLHTMRIKLDAVRSRSDSALASLRKLRTDSPAIKDRNRTLIVRDRIASQIDKELDSLRKYNKTVSSAISSLKQLDDRFGSIIGQVERYDFRPIEKIAKRSQLRTIYTSLGISIH